MTVSHDPMCQATSRSTGLSCQQPERWLMEAAWTDGTGGPHETRRVCQSHGKMLERKGWTFVRELHPVPGFERQVAG